MCSEIKMYSGAEVKMCSEIKVHSVAQVKMCSEIKVHSACSLSENVPRDKGAL
jgi:hypothetical protein